LVIFAGVSVAAGFLAWRDDRLSDEQVRFAAAAVKRHDPNLLPYDSVYGDVQANGKLRQIHTPVFLALMDIVLIPTDFSDPRLPFVIGTGAFLFVYLCGMYALLRRQCHSSSISAFVAILSCTVIRMFGDFYWGLGSLASLTPLGVVMAVSPWLLLSFLNSRRRPRVMLTFALVGLLGNVHLLAAGNLALVLFGVLLVLGRFRMRSLLRGLGGLGCFVLGAAPYLGYFIALRMGLSGAAPAPGPAEAAPAALQVGELAVLYPEMLAGFVRWGLYAAVLAGPSAIVLWRCERFRTRNVGVWMALVFSGLAAGLGLHGLSQFVGQLTGSAPVLIDLVQACCWIMPALYALFALAWMHVFRIVRQPQHRRSLRWMCGAFLVVWMLPSDNLRVVRHALYFAAEAILPESARPERAEELRVQMQKDAEFRALAAWARCEKHTSRRAVFLTDQGEFRLLAQRSLFVCREDVRQIYTLAPWLLGDWTSRVRRQYEWLHEPVNVELLQRDVTELARRGELSDADALPPAHNPYEGVAGWYVLLPAGAVPADVGRLVDKTPPRAGTYWRLLQIPAGP
jgi:hypothetical protein